jgi:hypothetical protein
VHRRSHDAPMRSGRASLSQNDCTGESVLPALLPSALCGALWPWRWRHAPPRGVARAWGAAALPVACVAAAQQRRSRARVQRRRRAARRRPRAPLQRRSLPLVVGEASPPPPVPPGRCATVSGRARKRMRTTPQTQCCRAPRRCASSARWGCWCARPAGAGAS